MILHTFWKDNSMNNPDMGKLTWNLDNSHLTEYDWRLTFRFNCLFQKVETLINVNFPSGTQVEEDRLGNTKLPSYL